MLFTGFDSGWGGRADGAFCDLRMDAAHVLELMAHPVAVSWDEACHRVSEYARERDHLIAIDQPLVVPNATGARPVDVNLARALMRDYSVGAHVANTNNAACFGPAAGIWRFLDTLDERGYDHTPFPFDWHLCGRRYFECYPHLAFIGLFSLNRLLAYKTHHKNPESWAKAVELVRSLESADPSIRNIDDFIPPDFDYTKRNEDAIDSIISAYVAAHFWRHGTARNIVLGSLSTGYLVSPVNKALRNALGAVFLEAEINAMGRAARTRPKPTAAEYGHSPPQPHPSQRARQAPSSATLQCTDTSNIWGNENGWMNHFSNVDLFVTFLDVDDRPTLRFVPFGKDGDVQRRMKISEDVSQRARWAELAAGVSKRQKRSLSVEYSYVARLTQPAKK
jgi:predicted RNase H-like nuclease